MAAAVCLAADTSLLDGFRALVGFLSWFDNCPAAATPRSFSAFCRTASDSDVLQPEKANNGAYVSPADRQSSPDDAGSSSATSSRSSWPTLAGAIAAREGRLLSLSTLGETSVPKRSKDITRIVTSSVSAAVPGFLGVASYQFVQAEREAGKILVGEIPVWGIQCVLPLGFALIAVRKIAGTHRHHLTENGRNATTALRSTVGERMPEAA